MTYVEHRARRLWWAQDSDGMGLPVYPYEGGGRLIGRVLMRPYHFRGKKLIGLVPLDPLMTIEFRAREKRQDRAHFTKGA